MKGRKQYCSNLSLYSPEVFTHVWCLEEEWVTNVCHWKVGRVGTKTSLEPLKENYLIQQHQCWVR
jgi:hypothetical protein